MMVLRILFYSFTLLFNEWKKNVLHKIIEVEYHHLFLNNTFHPSQTVAHSLDLFELQKKSLHRNTLGQNLSKNSSGI